MKFKKTRLLTKLLLLAVAVYAVVTLVSLRTQILQKQKQAAALEQQVGLAWWRTERLSFTIPTTEAKARRRFSITFLQNGRIRKHLWN